MKHRYRILTVGPNVHNLGPAMPLKMCKELLEFQRTLEIGELRRYIVIEEDPSK